jgi:nicotinamide-nucleotide amidase
MSETTDDLVERIAKTAHERRRTVAVAESLTSGRVAAALGAGPNASDWFRGGVVAYAPEVKFEVLGVTPGPVVTETCGREMARGVASSLGAEVSVALTGVGGPDPDEGEPAGTVYLATYADGDVTCRRLDLEGDPPSVVQQATEAALADLLARLED